MDALEFSKFENTEVTISIKMPAYNLNTVRQALNRLTDPTRCKCSPDDYPIQILELLAKRFQTEFEEHEGLNKYIERELAVKYNRDFTGD